MQYIKSNNKVVFLFDTENTDENECKIFKISKKKKVSNDRIKTQDKDRAKRKYHV